LPNFSNTRSTIRCKVASSVSLFQKRYKLFEGGARERPTIELWFVPAGAEPPKPNPAPAAAAGPARGRPPAAADGPAPERQRRDRQ
jgi:hypothetical protein